MIIPNFPFVILESVAGANSNFSPHRIPVPPIRTKLDPSAVPIWPDCYNQSKQKTLRYQNTTSIIRVSSVWTNVIFQKPTSGFTLTTILSVKCLGTNLFENFCIHSV